MSYNVSHTHGNSLYTANLEDDFPIYQPSSETPPPSPLDDHLSATESLYGLHISGDVVSDAPLKREEFLYTAGAATRYRKKYYHCFVPVREEYTPPILWNKVYEEMEEMDGLYDPKSHFIHANFIHPNGKVVKTSMYFIKCPQEECKYCFHFAQ
jgi:hypothetical protein